MLAILLDVPKDKSHVVISIDAEKSFDKIQYSFMIKMFSRVGKEENYFNTTKVMHSKSTINIILTCET